LVPISAAPTANVAVQRSRAAWGQIMIQDIVDSPLALLVVSFFVLWLTARVSASYVRRRKLEEDVHKDFDSILTASLTLLSLIIGFNLLTAVTRYDQRKNYEEAEANAIGTEYLRADLLPAAEGAKVRSLLVSYVDQRLLFYVTRDESKLAEINARTAKLQAELWSAIVPTALARPDPVQALVVSGMNDVLNSQGYTQAAWWNRIPLGAWGLMAAVALCCNVLIGYGVRDAKAVGTLLLIVPFIVSISFFLIADVDSPRAGVIRVNPQNLQSLATSLKAP
jgi:hypothetical protein